MDLCAGIHLLNEMTCLEVVDHPTDPLGGVGSNMAHISLDHFQTELLDHPSQFPHSFFVRGDLRMDISYVLRNISSRISGIGEKFEESVFSEAAIFHQQKIGGEPSICVMATSCHPESRLFLLPEDWRYDRDIGKMRTARKWIVQSIDIPRPNS